MTATPAEDAPRAGNRVLELDALRGLAALSVVLYHFTWFIGTVLPGAPLPAFQLQWGCYGVQLFFAISGFVILMTLDRTLAVGQFVCSRFRRLFPAYWIAMAATFAVVTLFGPAKLHVHFQAFLLNLPMLQLFTGVRMVDGVYWSLNVELAFYLCMLVIWRAGYTGRIERVLGAWIALKWFWWMLPGFAPKLALLLVADHIPYFAVGMVSYRIWSGQRRCFEQMPLLAFVFATIGLIDPRDAHWLIVGLIAIFLLLAFRRLSWIASPALVKLGAISYPLYLVHAAIGYSIIVRLEAAGVAVTPATVAALAATLLFAGTIAQITDIVMAGPPISGWAGSIRGRRQKITC